MLAESPDDEGLLIVKKSVDRLKTMIEGASKLSGLESLEELEEERMNLRTVINDAVEDCKHLLKSMGMRVDNRIAEDMPVNASPI